MAHERNQPRALAAELLEVDRVIDRVLAGEEEAWSELMRHVHPLAISLCQRRLHAGAHGRDEIARDVASKTLERLGKSDFAALRRYSETRLQYPSLRFASWLRTVVGNVCIDHLRTQPGHSRIKSDGARSHEIRATRALTEEPATKTDLRRQVEVRRVLAWLADPKFPSDQREALALWMRGHDAAEIAQALSLPVPADATRLLRAGRQRLRRHFEEN